MKKINLCKVEHNVKIGDLCGAISPNIIEDTIFLEDGTIIGFYIKKLTGKISALADIANAEFLSDRVPKTEMSRGPQGSKKDKLERAEKGINLVTQYSTILGSIPPKPHMKRPYPSISSVHQVASARNFIKAMILLCKESEKIIKSISPEMYNQQKDLIEKNVPPEYRFSELFTSSISNFNISAPFHRDNANIAGCVNVIIAKKKNAKGGNTTVPDYNATVDSSDNSMLVYPAWRNVHGVTPIEQISPDGYRNSLVFYPLGSFKNHFKKDAT